MNATTWILTLGLATGSGCARTQASHSKGGPAAAEGADPGEVKLHLDQTPEAVRATIQRELVGGELEDISRKVLAGKAIYETDIIRDRQKWEVIVGEDGSVLSRIRESAAEEEKDRKAGSRAGSSAGWRDSFPVDKGTLAPVGNNPYLPIQPGRVLTFRSGEDRLTVTILKETKVVDQVTTGVLEEREERKGALVEISRNYFATDPSTGDVYYFGEDVDNYKDGKVINHESAWLAGEKGARFGLMIPGRPRVGQKFYQELAPKVAMDRVEVVSTDEKLTTPAGTFEHCMHLMETTPLEGDVSHKWYAPGIGMVKDDEFELAQRP
jgi:hypothetical protein